MTTGIHIATGLNGQRSIWPAAAISFNPKTGEYKDFKGRVVKPVGDRMGVALDGANGGQPAKRKPVGKDTSAEDTLLRKLLPTLKRMVAESEAEAQDDADAEQEALFGGAAEDSTEQYAEVNSFYRDEKARFAAINKRNAERRGLPYSAIVPASREQARKAH